jgi:hypothetical protein
MNVFYGWSFARIWHALEQRYTANKQPAKRALKNILAVDDHPVIFKTMSGVLKYLLINHRPACHINGDNCHEA